MAIREIVLLFVMVLTAATQASGASVFGQSVESYSAYPPGAAAGHEQEVLYAPDSTSVDFAGVGTPGFVTVAFGGRQVTDGPGVDVIVHLFGDWDPPESFFVDAGDGVTFLTLGYSGPPDGSNGATELNFDLADAGLSEARFIRIRNEANGLDHEGPDVDAIEARNHGPAAVAGCADGVDNDLDGLTDFPADPGCGSAAFPAENPQCEDGVENDGDGLKDFPADPQCFAPSDRSEGVNCGDGIDDDGDGLQDYPDDPGCFNASWVTEETRCQNGIDDDGDGGIDFDGGASANNGVPVGVLDVHCAGAPYRGYETVNPPPRGCGLGIELTVLGALFARRRGVLSEA